MAERPRLSWKLEADDSLVHLSGEITEESDFGPLLERLPQSVRLDLAGVSRINSCGVREWINFLQALGKARKQVTLERCSVPMVAQLNSITNFQGSAEVKSVFAPYRCGSCETEQQLLISLDDMAAARLQEQPPCPGCSGPMEFEDFPEVYLQFRVR